MNATSEGTVGYFDGESSGWTERYRLSRHFRTRLETVLGWVNRHGSGLSLLDYGCGSGVMVAAFAQAGHHVTGADVSSGMLDAAAELLHALPESVRANARLEQVNDRGIGLHGEFAQQQYDGITCLGVIEYVEDPVGLVAQLGELIKPGGFLILAFPNKTSLLRQAERFVFKTSGLFRPFGLFPHLTGEDCYLHYQRYQFSLPALTRELEQHRLECRQLRYHVTPGFLDFVEGNPLFGMTAIAEFTKK